MSNLAAASQLRRAASQLPVSWYCDPAVFEAEQRLLFARSPGYVGHELMVPNPGDYHVARLARQRAGADPQRARASSSSPTSAAIARRSCSRAAATCPTSSARSTAGPTTCKGQLLGAPHFDDRPCLNLGRTPLQNWNGLLFDGARDVHRDLAALGVRNFDFSNHVLDRVEIHECNYNWKTFIEVYLEDYHVVPFHPGLGNFVTCDDLKWEFAPWASVQTVGITRPRARPAARTYAALAQGGARLLPRRDAASTARSGSPTTRTSCSSGIRTCW